MNSRTIQQKYTTDQRRSISSMLELSTCGNCAKPAREDGGPLSRCARCKTQLHCSTECQKKHWNTHKVVCKKYAEKSPGHTDLSHVSQEKREDSIRTGPGIMIEPMKMAQAKGGYAVGYWPVVDKGMVAKALQSTTSELAVSRAVGFPLRLIGINHGDMKAPNENMKMLGLNTDPDSPHFGQSRWTSAPTGSAFVARPDLKDLHISQVSALGKLCYQVFEEAEELSKKEAKGERVDRYAVAAKYLTPQAFVKFFSEMKNEEGVEDPKEWEDVECPVEGA